MTTLARAACLTLAATGLLATLAPGAALAKTDPGVRLTAALSGANEIGGGDPDGTGTATLTVRPSTGEICYSVVVTGTATPTRAHIHDAVAGKNGDIVVELYEAAKGFGSLSGCTTVKLDLARSIVAHPAEYYANVHDAVYPAGSVRGQLQHGHH